MLLFKVFKKLWVILLKLRVSLIILLTKTLQTKVENVYSQRRNTVIDNLQKIESIPTYLLQRLDGTLNKYRDNNTITIFYLLWRGTQQQLFHYREFWVRRTPLRRTCFPHHAWIHICSYVYNLNLCPIEQTTNHLENNNIVIKNTVYLFNSTIIHFT